MFNRKEAMASITAPNLLGANGVDHVLIETGSALELGNVLADYYHVRFNGGIKTPVFTCATMANGLAFLANPSIPELATCSFAKMKHVERKLPNDLSGHYAWLLFYKLQSLSPKHAAMVKDNTLPLAIYTEKVDPATGMVLRSLPSRGWILSVINNIIDEWKAGVVPDFSRYSETEGDLLSAFRVTQPKQAKNPQEKAHKKPRMNEEVAKPASQEQLAQLVMEKGGRRRKTGGIMPGDMAVITADTPKHKQSPMSMDANGNLKVTNDHVTGVPAPIGTGDHYTGLPTSPLLDYEFDEAAHSRLVTETQMMAIDDGDTHDSVILALKLLRCRMVSRKRGQECDQPPMNRLVEEAVLTEIDVGGE